MSMFLKILSMISLIALVAFPSTSAVAADSAPPAVNCSIVGKFYLPEGAVAHDYRNENVYTKQPPSLGSAAADKAEQRSHQACYAKNLRTPFDAILYFPLTKSRGALMQVIRLVACVDGGGYVFEKKMKPSASFSHKFRQSDFKPKSHPLVRWARC